VIGHNVQHNAHARGAGLLRHPHKRFFAAEGRLDLAMIDHVVAVGAAFARSKQRRQVEVGNA
jgi:hypothetical protein